MAATSGSDENEAASALFKEFALEIGRIQNGQSDCSDPTTNTFASLISIFQSENLLSSQDESQLKIIEDVPRKQQEHVRVQAAKTTRLDPSLCRLEGRIQALEAILQQTTDVSNPSTHLSRKRVQKQLLDCMTEALELRIGLATEPEMKTEKAVLEQLVSSVAELLGIPTPDPFAED